VWKNWIKWIWFKYKVDIICIFYSLNGKFWVYKTVIDEIYTDRNTYMSFIEFLEGLARIADYVSIQDIKVKLFLW